MAQLGTGFDANKRHQSHRLTVSSLGFAILAVVAVLHESLGISSLPLFQLCLRGAYVLDSYGHTQAHFCP